MAKKKEKPFKVFQTKEEFDKFIDDTFNSVHRYERAQGFKDGSIWVLSYIQELFQDMFKPEVFQLAQDEIRTRHIEQWREEQDCSTLKWKLDKKHVTEEQDATD